MKNCADIFAALPCVKIGEPLSRHTTMKVGGAARWFAAPNNDDELRAVLQCAKRHKIALRVLGNGSNLIAHDDGFDGVILHLGKGFAWQRADGDKLVAGGAALLPKLTHFALKNSLGNFEWACGVPGSVGGSLWGNAGARGFNGQSFESRDCAADFHSLVAFDRDGNRHELSRDEVQFAYRKSSLGELIVTEAVFALQVLSEDEAKIHSEAVKKLLQLRRDSQPVNAASAGCIWKNPRAEGCAGAGALIESLGLKGHAIGGARISEIHANFVVNTGGATFADVLHLLEDTEARVLAATGITLEREARLLSPR